MFELKITASTVTELMEKVAALTAIGAPPASAIEVPLPEPRMVAEEPAPRRGRKPKEPESPQDDAPADVKPEAQSGSEPTTTPHAPDALEASPVGAATTASPSDAPHAPPGAVYMMAGDGYNGDKRRVTYKDGARFSTVHKDSEGKYLVYAQHAPRPISPEEPTETETAQPAETESATSEPVTDASDDGPQGSGSGPSADPAGAMHPDAKAYVDRLEAARDFKAVTDALLAFQRTEFWGKLNGEDANACRRQTWETIQENFAPDDLPDPAGNLSAFRIWIEAQDEPEAIEAMLSELEDRPFFKEKANDKKEIIRAAAAARVATIANETGEVM